MSPSFVTNEFRRGAEGWTTAHHQNPAGENTFLSHPWLSAKGPGQESYPFVSARKTDSLAASAVKSPQAPEEPPPILGAGGGLTLDSRHHVLLCRLISGTRHLEEKS